jgi:nitrite reductase/ring-hydroxylating ferredoxin subunit/uncharacterized membrane protein
MARPSLLQAIEDQKGLDRVAEKVHRPVYDLMERNPALRTALDGTWLQHPLHAALTDVPVGAWTAGFILDIGEVGFGMRGVARAADIVTTVGLVSAGVAGLAGMADWSYLSGAPRKVGFVHAATNTLVAALYGASIFLRRRKQRRAAIALSSLGFGAVLVSAWLGGEMSYRYGVGVNHRAFEKLGPKDWANVAGENDIAEGEMKRVEVEGTAVLLAKVDGRIQAIGDTCTHLGCSLAQGRIVGDRVQCRCHGSQFRLRDGKVMVGPASVSEPQFEARVRDGRVEVRRAMNGARHADMGPRRLPLEG